MFRLLCARHQLNCWPDDFISASIRHSRVDLQHHPERKRRHCALRFLTRVRRVAYWPAPRVYDRDHLGDAHCKWKFQLCHLGFRFQGNIQEAISANNGRQRFRGEPRQGILKPSAKLGMGNLWANAAKLCDLFAVALRWNHLFDASGDWHAFDERELYAI